MSDLLNLLPVSRKEHNRVCNEYLKLEERFKDLWISRHNSLEEQLKKLDFKLFGCSIKQIKTMYNFYLQHNNRLPEE